ncbi:hypothetical protein ALC60_05213 [Trachymyrmex zeteki]|uniref:Uncharacterized protein n=1 Tax=Mycetomoellerius zeteki TaxID=64791 RepID=A0A151X6C0_9HYME|nr:hypothetical protein ALC60_05213 [Trachymyrmex zeteki]
MDSPRNEVRPRPETAVGPASTLRCESALQISCCVIYSDKHHIVIPPSLSRPPTLPSPPASITQIRPARAIPVSFFIKIQRNFRAAVVGV